MRESGALTLVNKLGMNTELKMVLNDNFSKFEEIIEECLSEYHNKKRVTIMARDGIKGMYFPCPLSVNTQKSIPAFRKYFGIRQKERGSYIKIAKEGGISRALVGQRIESVIWLLKKKHKKDIWYGLL